MNTQTQTIDQLDTADTKGRTGDNPANITPDVTLDVSGLACPLPGVKTVKAVGELEPGQILEVKSNNAIFKKFGTLFVKKFADEWLGSVDDADDGYFRVYLKKA